MAEPAGVPEFVGEVATLLNLFFVVADIGSLRGDAQESESQTIRPVFGNEVERVGRVAEGFGKFPPLAVADQSGEINVPEGELPHVFEAGHDHAGHPEEDDIGSGDEIRRGVEFLQLRCLFRPTHGGKRPEPGAEPGIQDVGILTPVRPRGLDLAAHLFAAIPDGNPVTPPELTADAPVLQILHPMVVNLAPALRKKAEFTGGDDGA